ncbi:hypothetical protein BKA61DRAFT_660554 [Leptodontidium sp. MPI-SDFR-AT-0119]|nr:hypothetical protein BKA61DRAFT_660554 [Leptodontidium sp. MPI-SDFR-AT-0119]
MEFVNIINTSLANDPKIGIRLPLHDVSQMCGGCRDGWVLAKLIDTWIPDVLDLGKLHGRPGGTEDIDLRAMTENNAIVQGIIKEFGCIATLCYELADIVKGAANIAGPLSEVINAGHQRRFPLDNVAQRVETYLALLEELEPDPFPMEPQEFGDVWHSAAYVLAKADTLQCRGVLTSTSLCAGEEVFHLAFIADLFVKYAFRDFGRPTMEPKLQIPISGRNFRRAYEPLDENKKRNQTSFFGART